MTQPSSLSDSNVPGSITYVRGDATAPQGQGRKVLVHIVNDVGAWGAGFVLAVSKRWSGPERIYREWFTQHSSIPLGGVQVVPVQENLWVVNLVGQHGLRRQGSEPPIRYDAVYKGLYSTAKYAEYLQASVHMPRIGCGLAGGTWDRIEPLIQDTLCAHKLQVFVYDL